MVCIISFAQKSTFEINFTAETNGLYKQLDSIKIKNLTNGSDTILYFPDTILILDYFSSTQEGIGENENTFILSQNYPNPFKNQTVVTLLLPNEEGIKIHISDHLGRKVSYYENILSSGLHTFTVYLESRGFYFFTVAVKHNTKTIKMISSGSRKLLSCNIEYTKSEAQAKEYKSEETKDTFTFSIGDKLMYVGHADAIESGIISSPIVNEFIKFQYATNIPCPGIPTINYGGQTYNTIQILSQCWLKENLNYETENSWCFNNSSYYCDNFGRLYLWEASLNVCPAGWHLPTDDEWRVLEGVVDSQYGILDPVWDLAGSWRGFDPGYNLKSETGWHQNGNGVDLYGFTAYPGGYMYNGLFMGPSSESGFWSSSEYDASTAWNRYNSFSQDEIFRFHFDKNFGFYVRCLKD